MNYKEIAKQGRYGDTELRIVDGQPSHVNTSEARDIDLLGKYGEMKTQLLGSDTTNPSTGLPEYFLKAAWNKHVKPMGKMKGWQAAGYIASGGTVDVSGQGAGIYANISSEGKLVGGNVSGWVSEKLLGKDRTGYGDGRIEKPRPLEQRQIDCKVLNEQEMILIRKPMFKLLSKDKEINIYKV